MPVIKTGSWPQTVIAVGIITRLAAIQNSVFKLSVSPEYKKFPGKFWRSLLANIRHRSMFKVCLQQFTSFSLNANKPRKLVITSKKLL
jgi:hypothetical protein